MSQGWTGMRGISAVPSYVIMQPTTLCNLDCAYCYLPLRAHDRRMPVEVARAVADTVNGWAAQAPRFSVVWHGGEPLATGREQLRALMAPFAGVEHHIQTNATLIDEAWCEFFLEHDIRVGLSIDGPRGLTEPAGAARRGARVRPDRARASKRCGASGSRSPPSAWCPTRARAWRPSCTRSSSTSAPTCWASTWRSRRGSTSAPNARSDDAVRGVLGRADRGLAARPRIEVREVEWALRYAGAALAGSADELLPRRHDPIPTIAQDGRVVLLSPELAGFADERYGDFASGSVLETPLAQIVATAAAAPAGWIAEYLDGVEACRARCPYFGFCGGAHAANRFFEQGRFDGTETRHCRNSKISLLEGVLDHARAA